MAENERTLLCNKYEHLNSVILKLQLKKIKSSLKNIYSVLINSVLHKYIEAVNIAFNCSD